MIIDVALQGIMIVFKRFLVREDIVMGKVVKIQIKK
jgi:hypothetical protein